MENVNESHDKPAIPSTNVETSSPSLQIKLDPTKKKKNQKLGISQLFGRTIQKWKQLKRKTLRHHAIIAIGS
jgi:hypothetical protein